MTEALRISLARDFSRYPGPRYVKQGENSGEQFRAYLMKLLSKHESIVVDLEGTTGIGSSFIDEAFGGLIFREGMKRDDVRRRVKVVSRLDQTYLLEYEVSVARAKELKH